MQGLVGHIINVLRCMQPPLLYGTQHQINQTYDRVKASRQRVSTLRDYQSWNCGL